MALCLWITCGILEMPNYFNWGGHTFDQKTMACSYDRLANYSYTLFFVLVTIAPPLVTVAACYLRVFVHVRQSRKTVEQIGATNANRGPKSMTASEIQLAKTLFIIYIVCLTCWAPYAVVVLVDVADQWPKIVYVVAIQMAHTNSSLNSVIYAAANRDFRRGYMLVLVTLFCPGRKRKTELQYVATISKSSTGSSG
jgi:melatonin receptor type 1B